MEFWEFLDSDTEKFVFSIYSNREEFDECAKIFRGFPILKHYSRESVSDEVLDRLNPKDITYKSRDSEPIINSKNLFLLYGNPFLDRYNQGLSSSSKLIACLNWKKVYIVDTYIGSEWISDCLGYLTKDTGSSLRNLGIINILIDRGSRLRGYERKIIAIDGIIAAGKTTVIKRGIDTIKNKFIYIPEPLEEIYSTIKKYEKHSKKLRQEKVEEVVLNYELRELSKFKSSPVIWIERNWLYAEWIFGVKNSPYPIPCPKLIKLMKDVKVLNLFLDTELNEAMERINKRDPSRDDMVDETTLKEQQRRLKILFNSWYDWPYGETVEYEVIEKM